MHFYDAELIRIQLSHFHRGRRNAATPWPPRSSRASKAQNYVSNYVAF